jgi:hypothetical protein
MKSILLLALTIVFQSAAVAGSGSAIVPMTGTYKNGTNFASSSVFLTNVTNHTLNVTVTFYAKDGTVVSSSSLVFDNWTNSNTQITANNSAFVVLQAPTTQSFNYGKAVITWSNSGTDNDTFGLIAHASFQEFYNGNDGRFAVPINEGKPF